MEVRLAGHNIDRDLLCEIRDCLAATSSIPAGLSAEVDAVRLRAAELLQCDNWTPETLSAAYARISRDPRPVTELREIARKEVDQARRSNRNIIFGLGHASVAEHAVFNLDILGVSRLAVEEIERMRLCSYTEKSQRYILLDEDFVMPEEVRAAGLEESFRSLVQHQNRFYQDAYARLRPWVFEQNPALATEKKNHRMLEGLAKEDARYGLSLATTVQLGETLNARNLEALVRRTAAHPLAELRAFSARVHDVVKELAPSVVKYTEPNGYQTREVETKREIASQVGEGPTDLPSGVDPPEEVVLIDLSEGAEVQVVAALMHSASRASADVCRRRAQEIGSEGRLDLVRRALRHLDLHDAVPREFEHAMLGYELTVSAACFGQLKRHRMASLTTQEYEIGLGVTIPPSFGPVELVEPFEELRTEAESLYERIHAKVGPHAAPYALLNAHRRRVLFSLNVREMYHLARLRLDQHAQWDIRTIAERMVALARERVPALLLLACGKDKFEEMKGAV